MVDVPKPSKRTMACPMFLDSGAHSLFNIHEYNPSKSKSYGARQDTKYDYYRTKEFWQYVDDYAEFLKHNASTVHHYVNVDAIHNPEITWEVQKYLENNHHLTPVPVVHAGTEVKWLLKYLKEGYPYIGLGGVALEGSRQDYYVWADTMYRTICPSPKYLPNTKFHGFAMTSWKMITRYPWWSVDSASWAKNAGHGGLYVPHVRKGGFDFSVPPYTVSMSCRSPKRNRKGRTMGDHYESFTNTGKRHVRMWLDHIQIPLGKMSQDGEVLEKGVINHYGSRGVANMRFFDLLAKSLPEWPWPFHPSDPNIIGFDE